MCFFLGLAFNCTKYITGTGAPFTYQVELYPVNPVSGEYILCAPLFDSIALQLPSGKKLQIVTHKTSPGARYIKQVKWNGQHFSKNFIRYADLMKGGKLEIFLQTQPSTWGADAGSRPAGLSKL